MFSILDTGKKLYHPTKINDKHIVLIIELRFNTKLLTSFIQVMIIYKYGKDI